MKYQDLMAGDPVFIPGEKRPFKVICRDERYIICTKPFNPKHTVRYFIIDLEKGLRGPDNMVFCSGYETKEQCQDRLKQLQNGEIEVSTRNAVEIDPNEPLDLRYVSTAKLEWQHECKMWAGKRE